MIENKQEKSKQYREQHREEINAKKRVTPVEIKCEVCGKSFTATNKRQRVCSEACRVIYQKRLLKRLNEERTLEEKAVAQRKRTAELKEELSAEEYEEYREKVNVDARSGYYRRLSEMSPEDLKAYRKKKTSRAQAWYANRTEEQIAARKEYDRERGKKRTANKTAEDRARENARARELYRQKMDSMTVREQKVSDTINS